MEMCLPEYRQGPTGKLIWRTAGNRNRYFSNLCNRSLSENLYKTYTQELSKVFSTKLILTQAKRIAAFLLQRDYNSRILLVRIEALLSISEQVDDIYTVKITEFFSHLYQQAANVPSIEINKQAVYIGVLFAWMFLFALCDSCFDELLSVSMLRPDQFDIEKELQKDNLARREKHTTQGVSFLGNLKQLSGRQIPHDHYFGHEAELMDLKESIDANEKLWITGIGGLGKTEITSQLLQQCVTEQRVYTVCLVEYSHSLRTSFRRALSSFRLSDEESENVTVLSYLLEHLQSDGLLIIDNMDQVTADDETWLTNLSLAPYPVIITSRMNAFKGFTSFDLSETNPADCLLIYRNNIGEKVSAADRQRFISLMSDPLFCHPQTVLLICQTVKHHRYTLDQLISELQTERESSLVISERRNEYLTEMYRHLYNLNHLHKEERAFADFFALLPIGVYSAAWLNDHSPDPDKSVQAADKLTEFGFLTRNANGYSMHPLIKQCLMKKTYSDARLSMLIMPLCKQFEEKFMRLHAKEDIDQVFSMSYGQDLYILNSIFELALRHVKNPQILSTLLMLNASVGIIDSIDQKKKNRELIRKAVSISITDPVVARVYMADYDLGIYGHEIVKAAEEICQVLLDQKVDLSNFYILEFVKRCAIQLVSVLPDLPVQVLEEADRWVTNKTEKEMIRCSIMSNYQQRGDFETACKYADTIHKNLDFLPEASLWELLSGLAVLYLAVRDEDKFADIIGRYEHLCIISTDQSPYTRYFAMEFSECQAVWNLQHGRPDLALPHLLKHKSFTANSLGNRGPYCADLGSIALAYMQLKEYDKAEEFYLESIRAINDNVPPFIQSASRNNLGVLYITKEQPEKAIEQLEQCLGLFEDGSLALAEPYRNLGRAYDLAGDRERASEYWNKAYSLLVKCYGEAHERTLQARERINE